MTLAELIVLILKSSIAVLVFTVGLGTPSHELTHLLRRPGQLVRSLVSMNLVMLALAVAIALLFPLDRSVKVVLIALALSPVPPMLPKKLVKAGGGHDYVMALLFSASIFAILWIPLASEVLDRIFPADVNIPPVAVAKLVSMTVLGPTLAGVVVRLLAPSLAGRIAEPLGKVATVLLLAGLGLMLAKAAPAMLAQLGDGTLLAIVAFLILGLVVGHLLGGPTPGDRSVLALATASRHPGVAMAIAQLIFPTDKSLAATVLLYLITGVVVTMPYVSWRKKALTLEPPLTGAHPR
jgi:BASS family bile acid:Na+ symporter